MIQLTYDNVHQRGDLVRDGANLVQDVDLETAVIISTLTERRAESDDDVRSSLDAPYRGGWWGDTYSDGKWGSRLWLLRRAVATPKSLIRAKTYIEEALAWMIEDGVAKSVTVRTSRGESPTQLKWFVDIQRPDGSRWSGAWETQFNAL